MGKYLVDVSALTYAQQGQALDILASLANDAANNILEISSSTRIIVALLELLVSSSNFGVLNAKRALAVLSQLGPRNTNTSMDTTLARQVMNSAALGQPTVLQSENIAVAVMRLTGDAAKGASIHGLGTSITIPSDFALSGLSDTAIVGFSIVTYALNPYGSLSGVALTSSVVSYDLSLDGTTASVSGLTTPLLITIDTANPNAAVCLYWDTQSNGWDTAGLTKSAVGNTSVSCATTHLTSFSTSSSAGSAGVVSLVGLIVTATVVIAMSV
jgi:hypothetical protein